MANERKITVLRRRIERLADEDELMNSHREVAELLFEAGQLTDAIDHLKTALEYSKNLIEKSKLQRFIGEIYTEMNRVSDAEPYLRSYLKNSKEDLTEHQRAHLTIGRHFYIRAMDCKLAWPEGAKKWLLEAKSYTDEALKLVHERNIGDPAMQSRINLNSALIAQELSGSRVASGFLKEARETAEKNNLHEDIFRCLSVTASLLRRHGAAHRAIDLLEGPAKQAARRAGMEIQCQFVLDLSEHLIASESLDLAKQCLATMVKARSAPKTMQELVRAKYMEVLQAIKDRQRLEPKKIGIDLADRVRLSTRLAKFYCGTDGSCVLAVKLLVPLLVSSKQIANNELRMALHTTLGIAYRMSDDFAKALDQFNISVGLARRPNNLRELSLCKLRCEKPYMDVMSLLEEAGNMEALIKSRKSSKTLTQMIYTRWSFGLPAEDLEKESVNMSGSSDDSSDELQDSTPAASSSDISDGEEGSGWEFTKPGKIYRNAKGETPLHQACIKGNVKSVEKLVVKEKHPVNVRDFNGWLPLHEAVNFNRLEIVILLLDNGAAINDRGADEGTTPLHDACQNGHLNMVDLLLDRGGNPCIRNTRGLTPLDVLTNVRLESADNCPKSEVTHCLDIEARMLAMVKETDPEYEACSNIPSLAAMSESSPIRRSALKRTTPPAEEFDAAALYRKTVEGFRKRRRPMPPSPIKAQPSSSKRAFVPASQYDREFTVPDNVIEAVQQCISSPEDSCPGTPPSPVMKPTPHVATRRKVVESSPEESSPKQAKESNAASDIEISLVPSTRISTVQLCDKQVTSGSQPKLIRIRVEIAIDDVPLSGSCTSSGQSPNSTNSVAKLLIPFKPAGTVQDLRMEIERRAKRQFPAVKAMDGKYDVVLTDDEECILFEDDCIENVVVIMPGSDSTPVPSWKIKASFRSH